MVFEGPALCCVSRRPCWAVPYVHQLSASKILALSMCIFPASLLKCWLSGLPQTEVAFLWCCLDRDAIPCWISDPTMFLLLAWHKFFDGGCRPLFLAAVLHWVFRWLLFFALVFCPLELSCESLLLVDSADDLKWLRPRSGLGLTFFFKECMELLFISPPMACVCKFSHRGTIFFPQSRLS